MFDLMVARLLLAKPKKFKLRDQWDAAKQKYPEAFEPYRIDGMEILRLLALKEHLKQSAAAERKKAAKVTVEGVREDDVLDVNVDTIARGWKTAVDELAAAIEFVGTQCGVGRRQLLPSATMLLPLALGLSLAKKRSTRPGFKDDLTTWFWCSSFRQTYAAGANTQAVADAKALDQWSRAASARPEAVDHFRNSNNVKALKNVLVDRRNRNNQVLRALMSLFVLRGARDWLEKEGKAPVALRDHERAYQFHHIFPENWLEKRGMPTDPIVNFALVTHTTNASLGKDAPSTLFTRKDINQDAMTDHRVDIDALKKDHWEAFSSKRATALLNMIKTVLP
jgi:hypothetical protein